MAIDPITGQEIPTTTAPQPINGTANTQAMPARGIIGTAAGVNQTTSPAQTNTAQTTTPSGSVSSQLDTILGGENTPKAWDVTNDQTVQGQIAGIIDNKNLAPLMERSMAGANESSNARGLLNSSMATQAGQAAVIDSALPIAQADASTKANAAQFNTATQNQFDLAKQQQGFDLAKMDKSAAQNMELLNATTQADIVKMAKVNGYDINKMNKQQINDLAKASVLNGYEVAKGLADRETQFQINKLLTDNKLLVDTNATAQKSLSDYNSALTAINDNKDLSGVPDPKTGISPRQEAINNAAQNLNNSLTIIGHISGIDVSGLLNFGDAVGGGATTGGQPVGGTSTPAQTSAAATASAASDLAARQAAWDTAKNQADNDYQNFGNTNGFNALGPRPT